MCLHITLLIIFNLLKYSRCEECVLRDKTSIESAWDNKIHKDKMLNYKYKVPPATNESCVPVKVQLQMKSFAIDEFDSKFTANLWTRLYWRDERFTWAPEEYGGVDKIVVHNSKIWLPAMRLLNSDEEDYYSIDYGECRIKYDGGVLCVPKLVYESFCIATLKDWPYDIQNCTLQFGNGMNDVSKFNFAGRAIVLFPAEYGNGWNIMAMESKENLSADVQLSVSLIMERQADGLAVILVVPCFIVCILTSISTLLNVYGTVRCGLLCFSLMSHFVFIRAIAEFLPSHSADTPVILLFFRSSLILTITSILFTYILSKIVKRKSVPFAWVSIISTKVFDSFGQYLIVPKWDVTVENEDVNFKNKEIWNNFANILNSVYLVIVVIVYISLFSEYMPKLPPNEY